MKIAPNQRQELDFLRDTLDSLDRISDRAGRPAFRALRDRLDQWAAKVAVIGQVKAGKSTFVNALLYQHDFLPSDVNPWTSVVTNIRINMPGDPASGARFAFFDENDWQEIVDGGSKIRELTEQLLPGFDTELLRRQSEEMRGRAQKRLGKHYHTLLGSQHEYDFLTPDLLKRYVCAGPGSDEGLEREALGRYAALTKVANAYMRMPGFQVPTIITDTPGVNDPFLVRDEFTCRSLDKSDTFVMVLSAHQPLTDVDIALIRILAQQDDKDVVIFVNRIDELDDYATEVPRVMADVSARLSAAIPGIDFRITAGSAYMADLVLRDDDDAGALRAAIDTPELAAYLAARHGRVPDTCEDRLMLASGLDALRATLSDVIDEGTGGRYLGQLLEDIRAEISGALFAAKRERDSLQLQVESVTSDVARDAVADLTREIDGIKRIHDELQTNIDAAEAQVEKVVSKAWTKLQARLVERIEAFVDDQKEAFEERLFSATVRGDGQKALDIDIGVLQAQIEAEVRSSFATSRAGTDVALSNCLHACRQTIRDKFDDPAGNITLDELPYDSFSSTLALSRRSLKIELITDRSWAFWRRPSVSVEKTLAALRVIAAAEMRPAVEKILAAFNEAQVERASAGIGRLRVLLRMIEVGLSERSHRLKQDRIEMERVASDTELQARLVRRLQSQMEVLERRVLNFSAIDSALSRSELAHAA
ncbi:dynamin family protein [Acidimangrovimonas sediminis]|uniref:dynamin family protein n=1 Tax=Acidimangrovimonas sediminis TaxID=2056283 RepID=UPI000C7F7E2C|nr:dynamin family protein [Acidimangrovimonas sediminis]